MNYEHHTTLEKMIARAALFFRHMKQTENLLRAAGTVVFVIVIGKLVTSCGKRRHPSTTAKKSH